MPRGRAVGEAEGQLRVARVWRTRGRTERAVECYDEALSLRPGFDDAFDELIEVLTEADDWQGIEQRCVQWLEQYPDHASHARSDDVHNLRIDALCRLGGLDLAFESYGLHHVSGQLRDGSLDSPLVVIVERNERERLPYLLEHHRGLGARDFIVVDNDSDDGSRQYLADQPDVMLWSTSYSYRGSNCGAAWWDLILRRHGADRWCLLVDADELFVYPDSETVDLANLCAALDATDATCMRTLVLDLYSDTRLAETDYVPGTPFLEACPFLDHTPAHEIHPFDGPRYNITNFGGGMRARVFGGRHGGYLMNKMCLFRYRYGELLYSGTHWLDRSTNEIADATGALLHFKYFRTFADRVRVEVDRREHANEGAVYRQYAAMIERDPDLVLYDPLHSVRYEGTRQLVDLGLMTAGEHPRRIGRRADVPALSAVEPRCLSSVVVIADGSPVQTRGAVDAARSRVGEGDGEIVVLVPRSADVAAFGDLPSSVVVHRCDRHLGAVELLTHGLELASGQWVQLQSGRHPAADPWSAIDHDRSEARAVVICDADGIEDLDFGLSPAAFVARRDAFVAVGGFCPAAGAAAAWEMVQRLAAGGDVRFVRTDDAPEPTSAASAAPHDRIAQTMLAIDVVAERLGVDPVLAERWRDRCLDEAADLVTDAIEHGAFPMALAITADALRVAESPRRASEFLSRLTGTVR